MREDALGRELNDGDIVAEIDPIGNGWLRIGIVLGGITKSGRVRMVFPDRSKTNAKNYSLIKISEKTLMEAKRISMYNRNNESLENKKLALIKMSKQIKGEI